MKTLTRSQLAAALLQLAVLLLRQPQAAVGRAAVDEATIMRRLRQAANDAGLVQLDDEAWMGWEADNPGHHCSWQGVACDERQHVTQIVWRPRGATPDVGSAPANGTLLMPELARFRSLALVDLSIGVPLAGIPPEWGQTGAFPILYSLTLYVRAFTEADPLSAFQPGAMPRLLILEVALSDQERTVPLPPGWSEPAAWPFLRVLKLVMPLKPPLPASWAHGFPALQELMLRNDVSYLDAFLPNDTDNSLRLSELPQLAFALHGRSSFPLPAEWASGFSKLQSLTLAYLGLDGTFPAAWQARGSFPALRELDLAGNLISGTLPADIVCNLPRLAYITLGDNRFTGRLPPRWAACANNIYTINVELNQLTGSAFPPAWVAPNSTLDLRSYEVNGNPQLVGPLPAALNWSRLQLLYVQGTGVDERIPEQWCHARFARNIQQIETSEVRQPGFVDSLPPCVEQCMPTFWGWALEVRRRPENAVAAAGGAASAALSGSGGRGKLLLLLGVIAACAGVAAAALKGRAHRTASAWLSALVPRRQRSRHTTAEEEGIQLLQRSLSASEFSQMRHRRPNLSLELSPGHARLKALAQRQLGGTALRSGQPEAQLMSMLSSAMHSSAAASPGGIVSAASGDLGQPMHPASGGGATLQLMQRWGLPTESLRMGAADLQLVAEPDGTLVQLGEGAHAVVFLAKMQGNIYVAAKVFDVLPGADTEAFWREVALLQRCVHPRIVPVYGVAVHGDLLMVAMQLMLGGSLRAALINPQCQDELRWNNRGRRLALDVAEAVAYLHEEAHILHADIKSANVLLEQNWRAALTDLGISQVMDSTARTNVGGTGLYAAPEQLLGQRCTLAADIYSLGLLLAELTTRRLIVKRGQWQPPQVPEDCPQDVADLIGQCLSSDPRHRPTAAEVLRRLRDSGGEGADNCGA